MHEDLRMATATTHFFDSIPARMMRSALLCVALLPLVSGAVTCTLNTTAQEIARAADLTDQVHVLTGGDSGIGYQTALAVVSLFDISLTWLPNGTGCGPSTLCALLNVSSRYTTQCTVVHQQWFWFVYVTSTCLVVYTVTSVWSCNRIRDCRPGRTRL